MSQVSELRGAVLGKGYRLDRRLDEKDDTVYEATHERIPGHFIIRLFPVETLLQPESSSRIQRGARVASLLRTPHAVQTLDFSASGEMQAFVVMERNPGRWLGAVLADEGRLPLPRAIDVLDSIATALIAGHQMGLVHGDVRPALVLLPESGTPVAKLAGFGWGKEWRAAARLPAPSNCLAPEQHYGKVLTIDERVDQFGLAALAYQVIAGSPPFSEDSADLAQMLGGLRPPPAISDMVPGVPQPLDDILRRALSFTASERFASVQQLMFELRAIRPVTQSRSRAPTPAQALPSLAAAGRVSARLSGAWDVVVVAPEPAAGASATMALAAPDDIEPVDEDEKTVDVEEASEDVKLVLGSISAGAHANDDTRVDRAPVRPPLDDAEVTANSVRRDAPGSTPRRGLPTGRPTGRFDQQAAGDSSGRAIVAASSETGSGSAQSSPTASGAHGRRQGARRSKAPLALAVVLGVAVVVGAGALLLRLTHDSGETKIAAREAPAPTATTKSEPAGPTTVPLPAAPTAEAAKPAEAARPAEPAAPAAASAPAAAAQASRTDTTTAPPSPAAAAPAPARDHAASASPSEAAPVHAAARRVAARPPTPSVATRTAQSASDTTMARPAAPAPAGCSVRLVSKPWAQVWIDGKNTGRKTPIDNLKVPCGTRKLELKRPDKGIEQMEMLKVVPGKPYQGHYELE